MNKTQSYSNICKSFTILNDHLADKDNFYQLYGVKSTKPSFFLNNIENVILGFTLRDCKQWTTCCKGIETRFKIKNDADKKVFDLFKRKITEKLIQPSLKKILLCETIYNEIRPLFLSAFIEERQGLQAFIGLLRLEGELIQLITGVEQMNNMLTLQTNEIFSYPCIKSPELPHFFFEIDAKTIKEIQALDKHDLFEIRKIENKDHICLSRKNLGMLNQPSLIEELIKLSSNKKAKSILSAFSKIAISMAVQREISNHQSHIEKFIKLITLDLNGSEIKSLILKKITPHLHLIESKYSQKKCKIINLYDLTLDWKAADQECMFHILFKKLQSIVEQTRIPLLHVRPYPVSNEADKLEFIATVEKLQAIKPLPVLHEVTPTQKSVLKNPIKKAQELLNTVSETTKTLCGSKSSLDKKSIHKMLYKPVSQQVKASSVASGSNLIKATHGKPFPYLKDERLLDWENHTFGTPFSASTTFNNFRHHTEVDQQWQHLYHFPHTLVDRFVMDFGTKGVWSDFDVDCIRINGEIEFNGEVRKGTFEYNLTADGATCYHRGFNRSTQLNTYTQQFPSLSSATAKKAEYIKKYDSWVGYDQAGNVEISQDIQEGKPLRIKLFKP